MGKYKDLLLSHKTLAIVDPPYGINVKTRVFNDGKSWDNETPKQSYFDNISKVSSNQIIFGANFFLDKIKKNTTSFIIWDKKMTERHLMSMSEFAWTSFKGKNLIFRQPPAGDRGFYSIDETRIHPTQKSKDLYRWLVKNYLKDHTLILDTHVGSASSLIAYEEAGLNYIGFELDPDYYKESKERLEKARFEREAKKAEKCYTDDLALFGGESND